MKILIPDVMLPGLDGCYGMERSAAKRMVEEYGGRIFLESENKKSSSGCKFL